MTVMRELKTMSPSEEVRQFRRASYRYWVFYFAPTVVVVLGRPLM
jgi:hypothetical protein